MLAALLLALQSPTPTPPPPPSAPPPTEEQLTLGRRVAASSGFISVLRFAGAREIESLAAEQAALTAEDREAIQRIGRVRSDAILGRLSDTLGRAYAERFSTDELRTLARYNEDPLTARFREAEPIAVGAAIASLGEIDFKTEVARAACAERRVLCDRD